MSVTNPTQDTDATPDPHSHVAPGPVTFNVKALNVMTGEGPQRGVRLQLDHAAGSTVLIVPGDFAQALAQSLTEAATGLTLARVH